MVLRFFMASLYHQLMDSRWHKIRDCLQLELDAHVGSFPLTQNKTANYGLFVEWLFDEEKETRAELDCAVRLFQELGAWPDLTPRSRYVLSLRLNFAICLLNQILWPTSRGTTLVGDPSPQVADAVVYGWLLSDVFHEWSGMYLKAVAASESTRTHLFDLESYLFDSR